MSAIVFLLMTKYLPVDHTRVKGIIPIKYVPVYFGYNDIARNMPNAKDFKSAYRRNLMKALKETAGLIGALPDGDINFVLAAHKDIKQIDVASVFDVYNYWCNGRLKFRGFDDPVKLPQLQLADLVAYEFSRTSREANRPDGERYPLRRLAEGATVFTLHHSSQ
ncbi:MAG: hypothetical protein WAK01_08375, partial [Methylocystis sp.]